MKPKRNYQPDLLDMTSDELVRRGMKIVRRIVLEKRTDEILRNNEFRYCPACHALLEPRSVYCDTCQRRETDPLT